MKRNFVNILKGVYIIMGIMICSASFADDVTHSQPYDNHYDNSATVSGQLLSDELKEKVAAILSEYDPNTLTAADAKAINNSFREAGICRSPGQKEAIKAAGFDPPKNQIP
jgi:hypothetical protein